MLPNLRMKVYKDYFKQILTGLMHILIEHSDLFNKVPHLGFWGLYPSKKYNEDIMN